MGRTDPTQTAVVDPESAEKRPVTRTRLALGIVAQFAGAATAFYVVFVSTTDPATWVRRHLFPH